MQNEADRLLDAALATYASPAQPAGFEQRILAGVRARRRTRLFFWFGSAAACAAVALIAVWWPGRVEELALPKPAPVRVAGIPASSPTIMVKQVIAVRHLRPVPRLERFPRSSPLTQEEKLLLQVAKSPEQAKFLLSDRHEKPIEPIQIQELQLPALNENE